MNKQVVKYCRWCGSRLVFKKRVVNCYDYDTGEPCYHYIYICPMRRYLLIWHDRNRYIEENGELKLIWDGD